MKPLLSSPSALPSGFFDPPAQTTATCSPESLCSPWHCHPSADSGGSVMTARRQRRLEELHCCGMAARTPKRSGRAVRQLVALKSVAEAGGSQLQGVIGVG